MHELFRDLHEKLLTGIEEIEKSQSDQKKQIEACFHLSENIRRQVDSILSTGKFANKEEEILFFRTVKPAFTSLVEFYSILYRAELFIPDTQPEQIEFWNYELQRARLFLNQHEEFFEYLKSADTSKDSIYFRSQLPNGIVFIHDELIAKLLAREKYINYINNKFFPENTSVNP
jgi:hypothetical protein